jgi:2,4-diaminopentanoate dehydrogenase
MMRKEPVKVIVWGPGTVGGACIRQLLKYPGYELVGVLAYDPNKNGQNVGTLVGTAPTDARVTTDKNEIFALDADIVLHSARSAADFALIDADVVKLLESGKSVISATSYQYPFRHGRQYVEMLHNACKRGGSRLLGTGVHPGFMGEILALTLSGLCTQLDTLTIREFVNLSHQKNARGLELFGFNGDPAEQANQDNPLYLMLERYWGDTLAFLARVMFDEEARIERRTTYVAATEDVKIPAMTIRQGRTAAIRHVLTASIEGRPRLTIDEYLYHTARNRPYPYVDAADFYEVEIEGRPSSLKMRMALKASLAQDLDFWPGDPTPQAWYATATPMVQAIPGVMRAEPGLLLPEVPRHFVQDVKNHLTMTELVRRELIRLGIEP